MIFDYLPSLNSSRYKKIRLGEMKIEKNCDSYYLDSYRHAEPIEVSFPILGADAYFKGQDESYRIRTSNVKEYVAARYRYRCMTDCRVLELKDYSDFFEYSPEYEPVGPSGYWIAGEVYFAREKSLGFSDNKTQTQRPGWRVRVNRCNLCRPEKTAKEIIEAMHQKAQERAGIDTLDDEISLTTLEYILTKAFDPYIKKADSLCKFGDLFLSWGDLR
jgi:hypothetical protein